MSVKTTQCVTRHTTHYIRSSATLTGWLVLRAGSQALTTFAIARSLGPNGYGTFVAYIAIASFFIPLAGFGIGNVILIRGAREPGNLPHLIGAAFGIWAGSTLLFGLAGLAVAFLSLPHTEHIALAACLVLSEIACSSLVELIARIEQSEHHIQRLGATFAGLAIGRMAGAAVFLLLSSNDLATWMAIYTAGSIIFCTGLLHRFFRRHRVCWPERIQWRLLGEGLPFGIGATSIRLQGEFNKPVLAQISFAATGNLNVAQRAIDVVSIPLTALQEALWPRLYAHPEPCRHLRIAAGIFGLAIALGVLLSVAAPLLPHLLGQGYAESATLVIWLAWLPCLQVVRNLVAALVIAKGRQQQLTLVYIVSAGIGIVVNLQLISRYALVGAVLAAYIVEFLTVVLLLALLVGRHRNATSP
jgi:O-antigen/teichoic acid export membrane protein